MARLILLLVALFFALPVMAVDDGDEDRGDRKKGMRADCERQANQKNLIGKDRRKFVKECSKEDRRGKHRGEDQEHNARPAQTQPAQPAAQPAAPLPLWL